MRVGTVATLMALAASAASRSEAAEQGACARLAPQLKMKQAAPEGGKVDSGEWRVDLLGGLGKALFGGSAASTMSVEPMAGADVIDYGPYSRACVRKGVNVDCHVAGPARLLVATDKTEAGIDLAAGETVDAGIRKGRHVYCRELR